MKKITLLILIAMLMAPSAWAAIEAQSITLISVERLKIKIHCIGEPGEYGYQYMIEDKRGGFAQMFEQDNKGASVPIRCYMRD